MTTATTKPPALPPAFWGLNVSQFFNALNDNVFRWVMGWALVYRASAAGGALNETPFFVAGAVFALPFILFSSAAGILADRFGKRQMLVFSNLLAVVVMGLGLVAFLSDFPPFIYLVLFLMASQSALLSPAKLGILPEITPRERLSAANGLMEMFVYVAIILGTVAGGRLYAAYGGGLGASTASCWRAGLICIALAALGLLSSLVVRDTGIQSSGKHLSPFFWKDVLRNLRKCRRDRYLLLTLFAIGFFMFLGGFVQMNVAFYGTEVLHLDSRQATDLFLALALGIGVGSYLAGRISRRSVEIGLVPLGALMLSTGFLLLLLPFHSVLWTVLVLFFLGVGGGLYIVPLNTFLQETAPEADRGEMIATANFLSFCGLALASVLLLVLQALHLGAAGRFALMGLLTLGLSIAVVRVLPDFLVRFIGLVMARVVYRLESVGVEHVPLSGGALLVGNHVSYVDAVLLGATHQRRIRFLMDREIYENRAFNWLFRLMQVIPVSQSDPPKEVVRSLRAARRAMEAGYLVCIFAEGSLTRTGYIMEFKRGLEHIVRGTGFPVIPVCLHGIWGSILSYSEGRLMGRLPRPLRRRVTVLFGAPMSSESNAFDIRQRVMELQSEAFERERGSQETLPVSFARVARSHWRAFSMADSSGKSLTFGRTLTASLALAGVLRPETTGQKCVGLLLPASVGGALANVAVSFLGKIPVNLNHTASENSFRSAIDQCGIRRIITSRAFIEKLPAFAGLPGLLYLEDLMPRIGTVEKVAAFLKARFLPAPLLVDGALSWFARKPRVEDTAVIIFSSGSTGEPKGVQLSHYNILSNAQSVMRVFRLTPGDVICGVLPFFHSFGYTVTLWLPLLGGAGAAYHFNPRESEKVGQVVHAHRGTVLATTPTFLQGYVRKVTPEQFASLRIVITGAEKLKPAVTQAFQERFGICPMEGYGATELSPVASVNLPNVSIGGVEQMAYRPGSIGRPIPGVTMQVVDPESPGKVLGYGEDGLLLVKGPNVMQGYLNQPHKTAEVLRDGWYVTGDIARIDHDGFVTITDRLSRFSKIGGEMVPHLLIEEKLAAFLGTADPVCAVTAVPDAKKGEQIVVLLTPAAGDPDMAYAALRAAGLPNLWVPARRNFFVVGDLPLLGTGKTDLKGLRRMADELVRAAAEPPAAG